MTPLRQASATKAMRERARLRQGAKVMMIQDSTRNSLEMLGPWAIPLSQLVIHMGMTLEKT